MNCCCEGGGLRLSPRSAQITVSGVLPLHTDGEPCLMKGTVTLSCCPQALTLLAAGDK